MVDLFPEAFKRFERVVDISRFDSYRELAYAFSYWMVEDKLTIISRI